MRTSVLAGLMAFTLHYGVAALAVPLQNGDFTAGFDHWTGQLIDVDFVDTTWGPAEMSASSLYQLPGGGRATLATDSTYFRTGLLQEFDLIGSGSVALSFDYQWELSDSLGGLDLVQGVLVPGMGLVDLLPGVDKSAPVGAGSAEIDLTPFIGERLSILFFVEDGGDDRPDRLTLGNVRLTWSSVPAPAPWLTLCVGAALLAVRRRAW